MVLSHSAEEQTLTAPAANAPASNIIPTEPVATAEEFKARVLRQVDLPATELVKGSNSRLVVGEQAMISFLKMDAHSYFAPHRHVQEQIGFVPVGEIERIATRRGVGVKGAWRVHRRRGLLCDRRIRRSPQRLHDEDDAKHGNAECEEVNSAS